VRRFGRPDDSWPTLLASRSDIDLNRQVTAPGATWHSLGPAQAKKAPATATIAKRLVDVMPGDTLKGRRDRFAGAFRKSEVVALNVEDLEICDEGVRITIPAQQAGPRARP
jgi:hypothetical protein